MKMILRNNTAAAHGGSRHGSGFGMFGSRSFPYDSICVLFTLGFWSRSSGGSWFAWNGQWVSKW